MGAIANLFGYLLNFLYNIFNNYGIAIIVFSVILRIILILLFWTLLIFDVFMLVYSYALEKRSKKNKNIYWVLLVFVLL